MTGADVLAPLRSLHAKVLGHPFVYDHVRPLAVGGIDMRPIYERLQVGPDDVVLDVGCGTGDALNYLGSYRAYHGFDTDPVAVERARRKAAGRAATELHARLLTAEDLPCLQPTRVALVGLLHHLDDGQAVTLLRILRETPSVERIVTSDVVFLDGRRINNLLAALDRGRHVRREAGYHGLARAAGLSIARSEIIRSHPKRGLAQYLVLTLTPPRT